MYLRKKILSNKSALQRQVRDFAPAGRRRGLSLAAASAAASATTFAVFTTAIG